MIAAMTVYNCCILIKSLINYYCLTADHYEMREWVTYLRSLTLMQLSSDLNQSPSDFKIYALSVVPGILQQVLPRCYTVTCHT